MTQVVCFGFRQETEISEIVEMLRINLKEILDVHFSKKSILKFIREIQKLDRWNTG